MTKKSLSTTGAPAPGTYSQAIEAGDFVFVTGQGPISPTTGEVVGATIEEQTKQTIANVAAVLAAAGLGLADLVKVTVYLSDLDMFRGFDATYAEHFEGISPLPVRTTIGCSELLAGFYVEIDATAYCGAR